MTTRQVTDTKRRVQQHHQRAATLGTPQKKTVDDKQRVPLLDGAPTDENRVVMVMPDGSVMTTRAAPSKNVDPVQAQLYSAIAKADHVELKKQIADWVYLEQTDEDLNTPLLHAARQKPASLEIVRLLVEAKADVNNTNRHGDTPLAVSTSVDVTRYLLEHKADVNARDKANGTPLHEACAKGRKEVVEELIRARADVNANDATIQRPLHRLFNNANRIPTEDKKCIARHLVMAGADPKALNHFGKTALDLESRLEQWLAVLPVVNAPLIADGEAIGEQKRPLVSESILAISEQKRLESERFLADEKKQKQAEEIERKGNEEKERLSSPSSQTSSPTRSGSPPSLPSSPTPSLPSSPTPRLPGPFNFPQSPAAKTGTLNRQGETRNGVESSELENQKEPSQNEVEQTQKMPLQADRSNSHQQFVPASPTSPTQGQTTDPREWRSSQVEAWLISLDWAEYANKFAQRKITGRALRTLTDPQLAKIGVADEFHRVGILEDITNLFKNL